ncbi:MAG: thioredoxin [Candidatus Saccharibacteria bacterium GW2011_GWC2_48_9]|nr:MAG: thioredoxin [Candidatus Saccharibacteria bacterium GW2011_GWC2_48_9]HCH34400.1 hypothetical protein [Candidatus Saccharibacteria bacterium]
MNKKVLIIIGVFVLTVGVASAYLLLSAPSATMPQQQAASTEKEVSVDTTEEPKESAKTDEPAKEVATSTPATYVSYSEQAFAADKGNRILFFHAPWCPQCRQLDTEISANIASIDNATIYKVDYDSSIELRKKYGVTQQTTFVQTNTDGTAQNKFVAYDTPNFASVKQNLSL